MAKQHTMDRRTGTTLCGRPMPEKHEDWSELESCAACARVAEQRRERAAKQAAVKE